jgi:tetratricopeptide (TPR) repeat protein
LWVRGWSTNSLAWDAVRQGEFERVPGLVRDAWDTRADNGNRIRTYMLGPLVNLSLYTGDEAPMLEARALLDEWAINWGAPYRTLAAFVLRSAADIERTSPHSHPVRHGKLVPMEWPSKLEEQGISTDIRSTLLEHAVELARDAFLDPENPEPRWNTLGMALYCTGDYDGALEALEKEYELRGEGDTVNWLCLALVEHARGRDDVARAWYERALVWMATHETDDRQQWYRAEAARVLGLE